MREMIPQAERDPLRRDAVQILSAALAAAMPDEAVRKALNAMHFGCGRLLLVAVGKAGWQMAHAAYEQLGDRIEGGVVITKYGHSRGPIGPLKIREAGHPVSDANTYRATGEALDLVKSLRSEDTVLLLISGGGSALFEKPRIPEEDWEKLNRELLASGADINEMNTVRKRFSSVKGGRFAALCRPAAVRAVILSDILGDPLDMIASGPSAVDTSGPEAAGEVIRKYALKLTEPMQALLQEKPVTSLDNVCNYVTGSVKQLCLAAEKTCRELGYEVVTLTDHLSCTARDAGVFLSNIARTHAGTDRSLAYLAGGETVVRLTGNGLGGRNQEIALAAAPGIAGLAGTAIFSFGSDGTDGPTEAAGGYADSMTEQLLREKEIRIPDVLADNDAYHALAECGGLIMTGPTGTNVNDLSVLLIKR